MMCLTEKIPVLEELPSGVSSRLMNQWYLLNKMSLNRNIQKTRFCIDWLVNIL